MSKPLEKGCGYPKLEIMYLHNVIHTIPLTFRFNTLPLTFFSVIATQLLFHRRIECSYCKGLSIVIIILCSMLISGWSLKKLACLHMMHMSNVSSIEIRSKWPRS